PLEGEQPAHSKETPLRGAARTSMTEPTPDARRRIEGKAEASDRGRDGSNQQQLPTDRGRTGCALSAETMDQETHPALCQGRWRPGAHRACDPLPTRAARAPDHPPPHARTAPSTRARRTPPPR